ncbi:MAG: transposase [Phycisphaerae bacterium]|nr:transposase [Phycisphaerae bacterium]
MPDTPDLQKHFGQPSGQQPGCGFPVAHLLALCDAASGLIIDLLASPWWLHDLTRISELHPHLRPGDVLVADRGFCSYAHLALLFKQITHAVLRVHQLGRGVRGVAGISGVAGAALSRRRAGLPHTHGDAGNDAACSRATARTACGRNLWCLRWCIIWCV